MTLRSIFEANSSSLAEKLGNLNLPQDSKKVEAIISEFFCTLFDKDGDYRENLTQSEDYIMQSAIALLNAQQKMVYGLTAYKVSSEKKPDPKDTIPTKGNAAKQGVQYDKYPQVLAGTAIGGVGGALVLGTWGALFGAIAGTAVVLYVASSNDGKRTNTIPSQSEKIKEEKNVINIEVFLSIIGNICDCVDELVSTFRSQINKVVLKYESQEAPTLEKNYRFLLEGIQSLLGYKRTHSEQDEKYLKKLQLRIEDVGELLENYNLSVVDYDGTNEELFEVVTGQDVEAPKMVYPAIVKDNIAVLKGKIFKH